MLALALQEVLAIAVTVTRTPTKPQARPAAARASGALWRAEHSLPPSPQLLRWRSAQANRPAPLLEAGSWSRLPPVTLLLLLLGQGLHAFFAQPQGGGQRKRSKSRGQTGTRVRVRTRPRSSTVATESCTSTTTKTRMAKIRIGMMARARLRALGAMRVLVPPRVVTPVPVLCASDVGRGEGSLQLQ
jgi:hypothetical protein